mgnify:CR=1 FL=1
MIRKALFLFLFLVCSLVFSGCHTIGGAVKGAADGAKQDWETAKQWDKNFRKNYW